MPSDPSQTQVIAALLQPATYPHQVQGVQHIETHISHLFLTGHYAYKLKKAVQFDFLDFSTIEKRRYYCERELLLNKRFAPHLYEAVVPLYRNGEQISFSPSAGAVTDYLVRMRQFDPEATLLSLLRRSALTEELIRGAMQRIAEFHANAELRPTFWSPEAIARLNADTIRVLRETGGSFLSAELISSFERETIGWLARHHDLLSSRQQTSVRAVHGDLHLGNLCVFEGAPTPFDGIEFGDDYSSCDVWADTAFLLMDLAFQGHAELASIARNSYLELTDDYAGLATLPFYLAYRASIRAKVHCLQARTAQALGDASIAAAYLQFAIQSLASHPPGIIAIGGFSGSGKSTLAFHLAKTLNGTVIRSDAVRKQICRVDLFQRAPASSYSAEISQATYDGMHSRAEAALLAGGWIILDAVHPTVSQRDACASFAATRGLPFLGLWCEVSAEEADRRLAARHGDVSDADQAVARTQRERTAGTITWQRIDMSRPLPTILHPILQQLQTY